MEAFTNKFPRRRGRRVWPGGMRSWRSWKENSKADYNIMKMHDLSVHQLFFPTFPGPTHPRSGYYWPFVNQADAFNWYRDSLACSMAMLMSHAVQFQIVAMWAPGCDDGSPEANARREQRSGRFNTLANRMNECMQDLYAILEFYIQSEFVFLRRGGMAVQRKARLIFDGSP